MTNKINGSGINRIKNAAYCSYKGFLATYKHESAFRQEVMLCLILLPLSFVIATNAGIWLMLIVSMLFLLLTEIMNSAIEALADRITIEHDELIGRAKDMASTCVFIAIIILVCVWLYAISLLF